MDLSKLLTERILLDTAVILTMAAAVLYGFGIFFAEGVMAGYGLTSDLLTVDFKETMFYGFVTLIFSPILSTWSWLISFAGLIPLIICMRKKNVPIVIIYLGVLFFLLFQFAACYETGEQLGVKQRAEITETFNGNTSEDFNLVKAKVLLNQSGNKQIIETGYSLDIPGDYFVLVQPNKALAIRRERIVTIEYEGS